MNFLGRAWTLSEEVLAGAIILVLLFLVGALFMVGRTLDSTPLSKEATTTPLDLTTLTREEVQAEIQHALALPPSPKTTSPGAGATSGGSSAPSAQTPASGTQSQGSTQTSSGASAQQGGDVSSSLAPPTNTASAEEKKNVSNALAAP